MLGPGKRNTKGDPIMRQWLLLLAIGAYTLLATGWAEAEGDAGWWSQPRRMIQTNLREVDAGMDLVHVQRCS